jgi:hypothetical protein
MDSNTVFRPLIHAETALPARRAAQYSVPKDGGDVLVVVCEGIREIKVTKPEPKQVDGAGGGDGDSDFESEEDEEEDIREIIWKVSKPIAEFAIKGVRPGAKVEVTVGISELLAVQVTAREVGGKGGVRGTVEAPKAVENGTA